MLNFQFLLRCGTPEEYQDEDASDPATGAESPCTSNSTVFTAEQRYHRRYDEAARILDRGVNGSCIRETCLRQLMKSNRN
jgi:hypothetical protein